MDGLEQGKAFFVQFSLSAEIAFFEVGSIFLLFHDGIFACFLLGFREEHRFVLIVAIERFGFVVEGFDFRLPFLGNLVQLFASTFIGRDVVHNVFHIDEGKLLR